MPSIKPERASVTFKSQLRTGAREAAAVLAAILVAFALNAWWESRNTNQDVRSSLIAVREEFQTVRRQLVEAITQNEKSINEKELFLALECSTIHRGVVDPDTVLTRLRGNWTFDPSRGALDALIQSEYVSHIRNRSLRLSISSWTGTYADIAEEDLHKWRDAVTMREAELGLVVNIRRLGTRSETEPYADLLRRACEDSLLKNLVAAFTIALNSYVSELKPALTQMDLTLEMLDDELDRK